jgi:hypothetical protein
MRLILFFAFIILSNCCSSQEIHADHLSRFSTGKYSIQYPKEWALDTSGNFGPAIFFFSQLEAETDKFRENVNVFIQKLPSRDIDLHKYKQVTEKQIGDLATDGNIVESAIRTVGGQEVYRVTYTMTQGKFKLKVTTDCRIINGEAYLATFTGEVAKYEDYISTAELMLNSIKIDR